MLKSIIGNENYGKVRDEVLKIPAAQKLKKRCDESDVVSSIVTGVGVVLVIAVCII